MQRRQVITITVEGTMQGLQVKPGKGLDLTQFGPATVIRASEIVWDELRQMWKVDVLQAAGRGEITVNKMLAAWGGPEVFCLEGEAGHQGRTVRAIKYEVGKLAPSGVEVYGDGPDSRDDVLFFHNYDEAVRVEIAYLDGFRKQGIY